jgi:hypothetical protein
MNVPAPYTMSSNVTDFVDMFSWMNSLTSGIPNLFGILMLVSIFMITFLLNTKRDITEAFAISSWITCVSSIFMAMMQGSYGYLIPGDYVGITVTLAAVSVILLYIRR